MTPLGRISGRIPPLFPGARIATALPPTPAVAPTVTPTLPEAAETPVRTTEEIATMPAPLPFEGPGPHAKLSVAAWPDNKKQDLARLVLATAAKFGSSLVRAPESPATKDEQQRLEAVRAEMFGAEEGPGPRATTAGMTAEEKQVLAGAILDTWKRWRR